MGQIEHVVIRSQAPPVELVSFPGRGRCFTKGARVGISDANPERRLRLDALARLVQDAGNDDLAEAGFDRASPWVARRVSIWAPRGWPGLGEALNVTTFCAGLGRHWGERRTTVASPRATVEVSAVWVFVDAEGRSTRLPDAFLHIYGPSTAGRRTSSRLHHPLSPSVAGAGECRHWPLRATDLDVFGHVNNSALWMPVEDELARRHLVPRCADIEFRAPVEADDEVVLTIEPGDGYLWLWITADDETLASIHVRT